MSHEPTDLDAVAAELYVLRPDQFTAARNARAALSDGTLGKQIKALRKPTVAAWAINLMVRDGQLDDALALAAALREAQDDLDAAELARLAPQRRALVTALARTAVTLALHEGGSVSAAAHAEIEKTINAAVVDAAAATAVKTGRLVTSLEAGGSVLSADVVGGSLPARDEVSQTPSDDLAERRARKAAEKAARDADRAANEARRELAQIETRRDKAHQHLDHLRERIDDLRLDLEKLESEASAVQATLDDAQREQAEAASKVRAAQKGADRARALIES